MSLNCPKCNHKGLSVAAMNYKETSEIDKDGSFSGGGVGIGTGGLGVLAGGGTYSEKDEIYSKRAKEFSPPSAHYEPVVNHFFIALASLVGFVFAPPMARYFTKTISPDGDSILPFSFFFDSHIVTILFPIIGVLLFLFYLRLSFKDVEESERVEKEETPSVSLSRSHG